MSKEERTELEKIACDLKASERTVLRAHIVLACAQGMTNQAVAKRLHVSPQTVGAWRERFRTGGVDALRDRPRPGQPRKISQAKVREVVAYTLETVPIHSARWSTRTMATALGLNQNAIARIWQTHGIKPSHQSKSGCSETIVPSAGK